jgi:hypothetical protein
MNLIDWELIGNPYNWVVILVIVAFAALVVTAYQKAYGGI